MNNPLRPVLDRIALGFTLPQKLGLTALVVLYVVSPIDLIPDVLVGLGWCDDAFIFNLLRKVWLSPTLPPKSGGGRGSSGALKNQVAAAFARARKDFVKGFADGQKGRS